MNYIALVLVALLASVFGDLYMQNPRGSNDRLNEANTDRNNANRLFDSQNNAKGGYCVGPSMSFYEGSLLTIEWTNQHGCGQSTKLWCNMVIQYMCSNKDDDPTIRVRDGTTTDTITDDANGPTAVDGTGQLMYGMHENRVYYDACNTRNRNTGLYAADRRTVGGLTGTTAVNTRQNNNGNRHGFECPEERDYYPYWAPSPWRDIAILAQDTSFCDFYKKESENVKPRWFCADANGIQAAPITQSTCTQTPGQVWTQVQPFGISAPVCVQARWSRDNHLGNSINGFTSSYNWTLPTHKDLPCISGDNCNCVLRLRYNISTRDGGPDSSRPDTNFIDWQMNDANAPIKQNPTPTTSGVNLTLAVDTSQFGRTFQDRTHVFGIHPRPNGISPLQRIFNLNVRGKRGNIVQTYPATEYDFVPTFFVGRQGDYIHFQWTGCDTNPAGNAGEGTAGTDRSNMVQLASFDSSTPATDAWLNSNTALFDSLSLRQYMAYLGQTNCLTADQLAAKNNNNAGNIAADVQNCMKLNAASPYFDGGLIRMNKTGTFYYMSTRNNNFTNRGQRAVIEIDALLPTWAIAVVCVGAGFFLLSGGVAGMMLYAKSNPHSGIAATLSKI